MIYMTWGILSKRNNKDKIWNKTMNILDAIKEAHKNGHRNIWRCMCLIIKLVQMVLKLLMQVRLMRIIGKYL